MNVRRTRRCICRFGGFHLCVSYESAKRKCSYSHTHVPVFFAFNWNYWQRDSNQNLNMNMYNRNHFFSLLFVNLFLFFSLHVFCSVLTLFVIIYYILFFGVLLTLDLVRLTAGAICIFKSHCMCPCQAPNTIFTYISIFGSFVWSLCVLLLFFSPSIFFCIVYKRMLQPNANCFRVFFHSADLFAVTSVFFSSLDLLAFSTNSVLLLNYMVENKKLKKQNKNNKQTECLSRHAQVLMESLLLFEVYLAIMFTLYSTYAKSSPHSFILP